MRRIIFNLDPIMHYFKIMNREQDFYHFFCTAELEDINGISITFDNTLFNLEKIKLLNSIKKTFLQVKLNEPSLEDADLSQLKPDMIIFYKEQDNKNIKNLAFTQFEDLLALNSSLQSIKTNGIISGMQIVPDLNIIKRCSAVSADYLELDLSSISLISSYSEELQFFENLKLVLLAADKLGFGVSCSNIPNYDYLHYLKNFEQIDEFIIGKELLNNIIYKGLEKSIQHFVKLIKY